MDCVVRALFTVSVGVGILGFHGPRQRPNALERRLVGLALELDRLCRLLDQVGVARQARDGSPDHLDYSVIGESVNLAARLCGFAPPMSIVVSDVVHEILANHSQFAFFRKRNVVVKGYSGIIRVYDLEASG